MGYNDNKNKNIAGLFDACIKYKEDYMEVLCLYLNISSPYKEVSWLIGMLLQLGLSGTFNGGGKMTYNIFLFRCAFLHFCSVKRPKLKQENPSLSVGAMAKQLSSAWKLMTPEQKKPYDEMALRDKQRWVHVGRGAGGEGWLGEWDLGGGILTMHGYYRNAVRYVHWHAIINEGGPTNIPLTLINPVPPIPQPQTHHR